MGNAHPLSRAAPAAALDVAALRAQHNPGAADTPAPTHDFPRDLDDLFVEAPIGQQLRLAVVAIDGAVARLNT